MSPKMVIITIAILPQLLFINTKQTSAQVPAPTNGMSSYGLGGYTMDDKDQQVIVPENARLLTADDVKKYTKNEHADKQFKPCRVSYQKIHGIIIFKVFYDEETAIEGCTVDFVFDKIDEITARIATKMDCLEDCGNGKGWEASSANLVPFTYSRSNEEIKTLHSGPPYNKDQASCKSECKDNGGKCMASPTSLQIAWNKCAIEIEDGEEVETVRAWTHLVGEPLSSWNIQARQNGDGSASFDLTIATGDKPTITIDYVQDVPHGTDEKPVATLNCFTDDKFPVPIPVPQFWTIKSDNLDLNGKQLLVFHLLPQAATRVFNGKGQLEKAPTPEMPKCKGELSIAIENVLGLLQSVPPPTTTTQTTEKTTSGDSNTTKSETTGASGNVWFIVAAGAGAILLLAIVVFVVVWCLCCRNKKKPDDEDKRNEADEDAEIHARDGVSMPESVYCDSIPKSVYCDSVPKSVYCQGVPDSFQSDYVE